MKTIIITIAFILLIGCDPKQSPVYEVDLEVKQAFFFKCLTLTTTSNNRQTHYSDTSKTVRACENAAIRQARKCVKHCK